MKSSSSGKVSGIDDLVSVSAVWCCDGRMC